jgi:hypothetical protein
MGVKLGSLTLMEEQRSRVFENRMLRRIFGPKEQEMAGVWRKLRKNMYASPDIIRVIR